MQPTKGDIVLLDFPFSDLSGQKMRPALVLVVRRYEVTVAFISSQVAKAETDDLVLPPATHTGLTKPFFLRLSKVATLSWQQIKHGLGRLAPGELTQVNTRMRQIYQL